ncbi:MAG: hypothetical protein HY319_26670 [Armatimonadetes bacterium]|nr:hypothetical protein [Armatimonadota bacterium]
MHELSGRPGRYAPWGIALVLVIMVMLVLVVMVRALVGVTHASSFKAQNHYRRAVALYLMESALADTLTQLESRPDWVEGFDRKVLGQTPGHYSLHFNTTGEPFEPTDSVNNLTGSEPADGPRGEDTVAPRTADLVLVAEVGSVTRQVEVTVGLGVTETPPTP